MSICVVDGKHCRCSPSEGMPCPALIDERTKLANAMREASAELTRLRNLLAADIHSCHDGCTRSGCVNGRLRAQVSALTAEAKEAQLDATRAALGDKTP